MQSTCSCFNHWNCWLNLNNGTCSAPWKGWNVYRSPAVASPLRGHHAASRKNHIFGGFCEAFSVSKGASHGGCMSLAVWVFIPASPGLSLHPNPLGEHGHFSVFQGWEFSILVKASGWFSAVTSESSSSFTALQTWQGHGAARLNCPGQEDIFFLKFKHNMTQ